jgi:AcrR family transcriptional regulator
MAFVSENAEDAASGPERPTRRERYRLETAAEAKRWAMAQLAEGGIRALSLNAIASEMGMTGPALYRYFPSRDDLLTELIVDIYTDFGDALWRTVEQSQGLPPPERVRAVGRAFRAWSLANPQLYLLIFGTPIPGYQAPDDRTTPAAQRGMAALLTVAGDLDPEPLAVIRETDRECEMWAARTGAPALPGRLIRFAVTTWTRLHGVMSLEIAGHFDPSLPDGHLFYDAELDDMLRPWAP